MDLTADTQTCKGPTMPAAARFVRDGTSRIPNFLNGEDGQRLELHTPDRRPVDTNTHTLYADRLCTSRAHATIVDAIQQSISRVATMRSSWPRTATAKSYTANDTRYSHLHQPHEDHVGPGCYREDLGQPPVGPLPIDAPSASAQPAKDPLRMSAAFMATERPSSAHWVQLRSPDAHYISPEFQPSPDKSVPWEDLLTHRSDVQDWRYAGRIQDAKRAVAPQTEQYSSDVKTDTAGRTMPMAVKAAEKNAVGAAFMSKEPRLVALPKERLNDTRLGHPRWDNTQDHLGPGAYGPLVSIGGARRKTYRLYCNPQSAPATTRISNAAKAFGSAVGRKDGSSAAFAGPGRSAAYGPFSWKTDSYLARVH